MRFLLVPILLCVAGLTFIVVGNLTSKPNTDASFGNSINEVTVAPSPTPTPKYFSLVKKDPNFSGVIETISSPQQITVSGSDGVKAELNLGADIPVYQVVGWHTPEIPIIEQKKVIDLQPGQVLSIYTENQNIVALFLQPA